MACAIHSCKMSIFCNTLICMCILFLWSTSCGDVLHIPERRSEAGYLIMKWLKCIIKCANGELHILFYLYTESIFL